MAKDGLRTMDVARLIKKRYQKARDLMLSGDFGDVTEDDEGRMTVARAGVNAWLEKQGAMPPKKKAGG